MTNNEKQQKEENISSILNQIKEKKEFLDENVVQMTPEIAKSLLLNANMSGKLQQTLIDLQVLRGLVFDFHPEEVYAKEKTDTQQTIYDKLLTMGDEYSNKISYAISLFQYRRKEALRLRYMITKKICFDWLASSDDCYPSFQETVLQVLSYYTQLQTYFQYLQITAKEKGRIQAQKQLGLNEALPPEETISQPPKEPEID